MSRVALYVRVSHEEQAKHGLSVDNQIESLTEYAKEHNHSIIGIYSDAGISGRKSYKKRPSLLRLLKDCEDKKIDLILFTKLDRWFRSVADYYEVQRVLEANKICWRAIWEDYETETANGVFKVNIMLSVAQSEADRTSERIKSVFEYKRSKGEYVGGNKAPLGYARNGHTLIIDENTKEGIKAFFSTYLSTLSQQKAIEACRNKGVAINPSIAQRVLYHPAYYGGLDYCTDTYISKEEHKAILKAKKEPTKHYNTGYTYLFSGICRCGICGGSLAGARTVRKNKNGTTGQSIRYVCSRHEKGYDCTGSSISEKQLESYMISSLDTELSNYNIQASLDNNNTDYTKEINSIKNKKRRLMDLYELGDLDFKEYKRKRDALTEQLKQYEKEPAHNVRQLSADWLEIYNGLDRQHKHAFWSRTVDHIEISGMRCTKPYISF